uniref:DUF4209 domain-containing protein n=1 Tax=Strigamia maritima TaxID=126957 RepID=T1J3K7_STRMM
MLPNGPRLRDHLSHGEVNSSCITLDLANHVACIAILACELAQNYMENDSNYIFQLSPILFECVENYRPVFPLHCTCKLQLEQFVTSLNCWKNCTVLKGTERVSMAELEQIETYECLPSSLTRFIIINTDLNPLLDSLSSLKLDVLYRSPVELEKIGHIFRICEISCALSEQIQTNVKSQVQKLSRHEMRSRNRETYNRMLKAIPAIGAGMRITATILVDEFESYNNGICNNKLSFLVRI